MENKDYIGDGVYVASQHGQIHVTTENGVEITNRVVLETETLDALLQWLSRHGWIAPRANR